MDADAEWLSYHPEGDDADKRILVDAERETVVFRGDVPGYFSQWNLQAIRIFIDYKNEFGLPYSGAWLEQPWIINVILRTLNAEYSRITKEERERGKRHSSVRHSRQHTESFGQSS